MSTLVDALWVGPYAGEIARLELVPGETVASVPREEAETSEYWQIQDAAQPFAGYDATAAGDLVAAVAQISLEDACAVRDYELAHKNRSTVIAAAQARITEVTA